MWKECVIFNKKYFGVLETQHCYLGCTVGDWMGFSFFFLKALIQTLCERLLTRIAQHILSCKLYKQHVPSAVMFA